MKIIDKLFRKEVIKRGDGKIYLHRWTILRTSPDGIFNKIGLGDIRIYIHRFTESDHTLCLHDHPANLISLIFKNGYIEEFWDNKKKSTQERIYKAPCLRSFSASHTHRVTLINNKPTWSLVFLSKKTRPWGFWLTKDSDGKPAEKRKWIRWDKYYEKYGGNGGCD